MTTAASDSAADQLQAWRARLDTRFPEVDPAFES
jgi:hypothetical protein